MNVLNFNIAVTGFEKRKLSKHTLAVRKLYENEIPLPCKKRPIVLTTIILNYMPFVYLALIAAHYAHRFALRDAALTAIYTFHESRTMPLTFQRGGI